MSSLGQPGHCIQGQHALTHALWLPVFFWKVLSDPFGDIQHIRKSLVINFSPDCCSPGYWSKCWQISEGQKKTNFCSYHATLVIRMKWKPLILWSPVMRLSPKARTIFHRPRVKCQLTDCMKYGSGRKFIMFVLSRGNLVFPVGVRTSIPWSWIEARGLTSTQWSEKWNYSSTRTWAIMPLRILRPRRTWSVLRPPKPKLHSHSIVLADVHNISQR